MKKSLIALAVAGALTAPMIAQADATLYGVAQYRGIAKDDSTFENKMAKTRLGVKGTVDNDIEGLTTGFQFEWEFSGNGDIDATTDSADVSVRKSNVYLKGDFGIVALGRMNNPANAAEAKTDILGNDSAFGHMVPDRVGRAAGYITPTFSGFEAYIVAGADGAAEDRVAGDENNDVDALVYGVNYSGMGFGASVGVLDLPEATDGAGDITITTFGLSYDGIENLYLGATYSDKDDDTAAADLDTTSLAASYSFGKVTLAGIYTIRDEDGAEEQKQTLVGVRYALGAKASVGVDYAFYDSDAEAAGNKDTLVLEYTLSF
ncbi:porin [Motiliproteus sp.]|uniref:porin n=1 Tax=Motiliproteus sp. TaxID=1898955 RepID=UPI003BAAC5B5